MDWIPAIGAIVGALLGAAFGGFLRDKLAEKHFKPVINIVSDDTLTAGIGLYYHRIMVKNTGKRAAKNCIAKVTLEDVTRDDIVAHSPTSANENDGYVVDTSTPKPILDEYTFTDIKEMSVCWSRIGNPESITINRDDTEMLDLYRVISACLELPTERGWNPFRVGLKADKEYLGEILVTSENAQTVRAKFKLTPKNRDDLKFTILD